MEKDNLKSLLSMEEIPLLSENFEEQVMGEVLQNASRKKVEHKYVKRMHFYFAVGVILGMVLATSFLKLEFSLGQKVFQVTGIILQIPMLIVLLFLFERIYRVALYRKKDNEDVLPNIL